MRIDPLTPRETECAILIADGLKDRDIADAMHVQVDTVKKFVHDVMVKTGTFNRVQLAVDWNCELFQIGMRELGILKQ